MYDIGGIIWAMERNASPFMELLVYDLHGKHKVVMGML